MPEQDQEKILNPSELIRLSTMTGRLLEETKELDDAGRRRLGEVHQRAVALVHSNVSVALRDELSALVPPLEGVVTDAELRVAQAQLAGWLDGLLVNLTAALAQQEQELANRPSHGSHAYL